MNHLFGKVSYLRLETAFKQGETYLKDLSFTAPFKVMTPFRKEDGAIEVMLLSASAGILEGDLQKMEFIVRSGSRMSFSSQSYEKIHRMEKGEASRTTIITIEPDAFFFYRPLPTIPFAGSAFSADTKVALSDTTAQFVYQEILSCGRKCSGEAFAYRYYRSKIRVYQNDRLIFCDNTHFSPETQQLSGFGMYEGYSHLLTLLYFCDTVLEERISQTREYFETTGYDGGISLLPYGGISIRVLGNSAQELEGCAQGLVAILTE